MQLDADLPQSRHGEVRTPNKVALTIGLELGHTSGHIQSGHGCINNHATHALGNPLSIQGTYRNDIKALMIWRYREIYRKEAVCRRNLCHQRFGRSLILLCP